MDRCAARLSASGKRLIKITIRRRTGDVRRLMTQMPHCWDSKLVRFSVRTKKLPISYEIGSFFI